MGFPQGKGAVVGPYPIAFLPKPYDANNHKVDSFYVQVPLDDMRFLREQFSKCDLACELEIHTHDGSMLSTKKNVTLMR